MTSVVGPIAVSLDQDDNQIKHRRAMTTTTAPALDLLSALVTKGKAVRQVTGTSSLRGGCAVIVIDPAVFTTGGLAPLTIGLVNGGVNHTYGTGQHVDIMFNYSAFKDDRSCSCSGGPGTMINPSECLRPTGLEVELDFWNWNGAFPGHNRGVYYKEYVPLFEFYQPREAAQVQPKEIDADAYNQFKKTVGAFPVDVTESFFSAWEFNGNEPTYWKQVTKAYALPAIVARTTESLAVNVVYKMTYTANNSLKGVVNPPRPAQDFEVPMLVYGPKFKALTAMPNLENGEQLTAWWYNRHATGQQ